jgi:hypothetical protein
MFGTAILPELAILVLILPTPIKLLLVASMTVLRY